MLTKNITKSFDYVSKLHALMGIALAVCFWTFMCLDKTKMGLVERESRANGFTLIEIMVVSAIITVGAALAVPAYIQWMARYELRQATTELASNLNLAKMAAKNRNAPVSVQLSMISCPPATTQCGRVSVTSGAVAGPIILPAKITGFTGGPVQFNALGLLVGANQVIAIQAQTSAGLLTYSTAVTPAGKVSWCPKATCP